MRWTVCAGDLFEFWVLTCSGCTSRNTGVWLGLMGHAGSEAIRSGANSRVDGWSGMRCGPSRAKVWMEIRSFHTLPSTDMWNWSSNQGLLMVDGRGGFNASRVIGNFSWFGDDSCLGLVGASSSNLTSKTQNLMDFFSKSRCMCLCRLFIPWFAPSTSLVVWCLPLSYQMLIWVQNHQRWHS